ncbi:MAG TPA: aldo/keto reductase [Solirubrobacteraceae bacterium]
MSLHTPGFAIPRTVLGRTGLEVSKLSLGTWGFGNASAPEARIGDDDNLIAVLRAAFAAGVTILDSAEAYDNEERLGRLLKRVDNVPDNLVIGTKFGHGKGFTADQFKASVERSLKELELKKIELMMIHDPRNEEDMKTVLGKGGAVEALRKLQDEGLVGSIGVATGTLTPLKLAVECGEFDAIQFPRLYTLLNPAAAASGLLDAAKEKNIGTLLAAPFAGNILATGVRGVKKPLYGYWPALPEVIEAVGKMQDRAQALGLTIAQAALAYPVTSPLVHSTVVGITRPSELQQNLDAFGVSISREDLESIAEAGQIDEYFLGGPEFAWPFPEDRKEEFLGS